MINRAIEIISYFRVQGRVISCEAFGSGHINSTFRITLDDNGANREFVLQTINTSVFKNPDELMENYIGVTRFLRKKAQASGGDPDRETLNLIKTIDGKYYHVTDDGQYWRLMLFVADSISYDKVERPEQFYDSAKAFGNFQRLLADYPADTLHETIPNFHNTPDRYAKLFAAADADPCGRRCEVLAELEFVREREAFVSILEDAFAEGRLPIRVTHNDTKLNNILFDKKSGKSICVIDLDTIMPGYSVNDFGDSIRFGATTAAEDESDLDKVNFDISLYELYVKGFIEGVSGGLTDCEIDLMPIGAIMMTLECGMRFLTDYIEGDVYFRTSRPKQNLDRARNQFKLVRDMEENLERMQQIVKKYNQHKS